MIRTLTLALAVLPLALHAQTPPSPAIGLAYVDPDTSNVVALSDGGTLNFPNTAAGGSAIITIMAANTGTDTGSVSSISLDAASSSFQLVSIPLLPASVAPSQALRFGVRFTPTQPRAFATALTVSAAGRTITVKIQAQAVGAQFSYANGTNPIGPGATLAFGNVNVGQTSSMTITITNSGNGDGQIAGFSLTGQGFSLSDLPPFPVTIHPNGSQQFTLNFTPTQPDAVTGHLTIGGDSFIVNGTGIGSRLGFTYTNAAASISVNDGGTVIFPPVQVGKNTGIDFSIQNTGTSAATISSINLAAASSVFTLSGLPALPLNLDAGSSIAFHIDIAPNNTGTLTSTMRVNTSSFILSGTGTEPAPLPAYKFQPSSAAPQAGQQPSVGLTLSVPYPLALQGTLKLSFASGVFADDPAVQFASGGRTVAFTIPANSTQALFNGNPTIAFQTGTTAGDISLTPSFAMTGGYDITPASPAALTFTIPRAAPQILNASISGQTLSSFTLVLSGYSTTRGLRQFDIDVTPKSGAKFSSAHLSVDVSSAATAWFQGAGSQSTGGLFLVGIPLNLSNGSATDDLVHMLQSVSVTATNDAGQSSSATVSIQ